MPRGSGRSLDALELYAFHIPLRTVSFLCLITVCAMLVAGLGLSALLETKLPGQEMRTPSASAKTERRRARAAWILPARMEQLAALKYG